jgi:hypothetical protein
LGILRGQAIALQIEKNALIEMLNIENALTAAIEDFDFVIEHFHKPTRLSFREEIGNFIKPSLQFFDKAVKTSYVACFNAFDPGTHLLFCICL